MIGLKPTSVRAKAGKPARGNRPARTERSRNRFAGVAQARRAVARLKERLFTRIAAEVERTGRKTIVMHRCRAFSQRMKARPGCSTNRTYPQYFAWLRAGRKAEAIAKKITARSAEEIKTYLPHIVTHAITNGGLFFATAFAEAKKSGMPITVGYATYLRRARQLGSLELIATARQLARTRARLEREHSAVLRSLDHKEARLLGAISFPKPR